MKKILFVLGTRPEAIKMIPIMLKFKEKQIPFEILLTGQHKTLPLQVLSKHKIKADCELNVFDTKSNLITNKCNTILEMNRLINHKNCSHIFVQGDTLSALIGAEYGFLNGIPVVHIEAGMRTYRNDNPYPEETFRRMITTMSKIHFCPSEDERENLIKEGIDSANIHVVGNTFTDYRLMFDNEKPTEENKVLITVHRRENLHLLDNIFGSISKIANNHKDLTFIFPVHPNPKIEEKSRYYLSHIDNIKLTTPLPVDEFYRELLSSKVVITDSGGVQEECILNSKKVLILREVTERKSDFDFTKLVSPQSENIEDSFMKLLEKKTEVKLNTYYGNGTAAEKISQIMMKEEI